MPYGDVLYLTIVGVPTLGSPLRTLGFRKVLRCFVVFSLSGLNGFFFFQTPDVDPLPFNLPKVFFSPTLSV